MFDKRQVAATSASILSQALTRCRKHFLSAAAFSGFLNLLGLAPTIYMLQVYDRVVPTRGGTTLFWLTIVLVLVVGALAALDLVRTRLLVRASVRLDRELAGPIIAALLERTSGADRHGVAALREFDQLRHTVTGPGMLALFDLPWAVIYIAICCLIHPWLGCLAIVASLLLLTLSFCNERATANPLRRASVASSDAYLSLDRTLASAGVVRGLGMQRALVTRALRARRISGDLHTHAAFWSASFVSGTKGIRLMLQSISLGLGALLAIQGEISAGAIFAASLLVARALAPIELITGAWRNVVQARAAWATLDGLFRDSDLSRERTSLPTPAGHLDVRDLTVAAPGGESLLLDSVSFSLQPGEMLGIVGPSGAGKSTLARALIAALAPDKGTVRLDGAMLTDWPEEQRARATGYVPQEPSLFRGTIKENIARFDVELASTEIDAEVVRAATVAGVHDLILRLPGAYERELGDGGAGLSVGQAQRIALARAIYGRPCFVVLDEPNSALDIEGDTRLNAALAKLRDEHVTTVVIAHRPSVLAQADKLLMLRDGRVELFGRRHDVLAHLAAAAATPRANAAAPQSSAFAA